MNLKEKVAIVTGGAIGIGEAICRRMAQEGASVVVADIAIEQAEKLSDELKNFGARALALKVDVTKSQDANKMVTAALDEFGKVDILVNNVGGTSREKGGPLWETTEEIWDWVISLNLKSVFNCTKAVINHMIEKRAGKIISIASVAGVIGNPGRIDYSSAKAGVICFTRTLAKEVGSYGIRVNAISPGPIETGLLFAAPPQRQEELRKSTYVGRFGKPEELANMVVFIASDEADFITGQNFIVDGGRTLGA